jgi:hypothetical protein
MPGTPLRYSRSAYNWKLAPLVHAMRDLLGQRGLSWLLRAPAEASGYPTGQEPSGYWPRCRCGAFRRFFSVHSRRSCSFGVEVFVGTTTKTGELLLTKAQKSMFKTTTVNRYLIFGGGAMTTRRYAGSPQRSAFKPNTATIAGNST